ncbi:MAG: serine/threonine-protein kinase, partial [Myxococcota bacterium]|nr:serine/threonine-protein kinase [Myxococcota bacterium]
GESLQNILRNAAQNHLKIPHRVSAKIICDAADALHHAHTATSIGGDFLEIVHRDVSPQNIMVRSDGVTKLVDFGVARAANRLSRTETGMVKGKMSYMSPEQVQGQKLDGRSDLYTLGLVFWELLACRRWIENRANQLATLNAIVKAEVPDIRNYVPDVPEPLLEVLNRCFHVDPDKRFQSGLEMRDVLAKYLEEGGLGLVQQEVARFVQDLCGEDIKLRTQDLQPEDEELLAAMKPAFEKGKTEILVQNEPTSFRQIAAQDVAKGHVDVDKTPSASGPPQSAGINDAASASIQNGEKNMPKAQHVVLFSLLALLFFGGVLFSSQKPIESEKAGAEKILALQALEPQKPESPKARPDYAEVGAVLIKSVPRARVFKKGKALGFTPLSLKKIDSRVEHRFRLQAEGYRDRILKIKVEAGKTKRVNVKLIAMETENSQLKTFAPSKMPADTWGAAKKVGESGFVSVQTEPWTKVMLDGKNLGETPLFKKKVHAGMHRFLFVNEEKGIFIEREVEVKSGETLKLNLTF